MKPEPRLCARRAEGWLSPPPWPGRLRLRKSLKNCSNGDPGGNIGISGPAPGPGTFLAVIVWVDETFTTAGNSLAARSAKLSGAERAAAGWISGTDVGTRAKAAPSRAAPASDGRNRRMIGFPGGLAAFGPDSVA